MPLSSAAYAARQTSAPAPTMAIFKGLGQRYMGGNDRAAEWYIERCMITSNRGASDYMFPTAHNDVGRDKKILRPFDVSCL